MKQGHKTWMAALAFALCANAAVAVQTPDDNASVSGPDASALMAFYGVSLATSPVNAVEDKAVWMAKVQGLIAQAPAWLQQNVLASKTKAEFAANLALLQQMEKGTLESGVTAVKSVAASAKVKAQDVDPNNLGGTNDLTYLPIEPCRIMDTRSATLASGVQGPILGNSLKQLPGINPSGGNWGIYGGNASSDCSLNTGAIYAMAIVITILNPNFDAFLGVSDQNNLTTTLSTVALNFTHGQGLSTMYIVPQNANNIYFAMPTGLSANIIFDVVGVFQRSQATALQCVNVSASGVGTANFVANSDLAVGIPACTSGYTRTGTGCSSDDNGSVSWLNENSPNTYNDCVWHNTGAFGTRDRSSYHAEAICCRIPGR